MVGFKIQLRPFPPSWLRPSSQTGAYWPRKATRTTLYPCANIREDMKWKALKNSPVCLERW